MTSAPGNAAISPPGSDEYADYYETYVGKVDHDVPILDLLEAQRIEVTEILSAIDDERAQFRYAKDKWSIKEVIGHMIDTERIFAYRGLCFARGEKQALPGMDQDEYVVGGSFDERNIANLALEYQTVRRSSVAPVRRLLAPAADEPGHRERLRVHLPRHALYHRWPRASSPGSSSRLVRPLGAY